MSTTASSAPADAAKLSTKKRRRTSEFLEGTSTTFTVEEVIRAGGGYRPSFRFKGYVTKGCQPNTTGHAPEAGTQVPNLHLILRYEPPSPKFKRSNPGSVSYRMQVADGDDFLFSMRGLPAELHVDKAARMLAWGKLGIVFAADDHLDQFLATIKYVDVTHASTPAKATAKAAAAREGSTALASSSRCRPPGMAPGEVRAEIVTDPGLKVEPGARGASAKAAAPHGGRRHPNWHGLAAATAAAGTFLLLLLHRNRRPSSSR